MPKSQTGLAWIPILVLILFLGVGYTFIKNNSSKSANLQNSTSVTESSSSAQPSLSPSPSPTISPKAIVSATTVPTPSKPGCDQDKDICFENNDLNITIYEGNLEDNDKWITEQLYIVGQTEKGFEISSEGIPSEFTFYTPNKSFPNKKKNTIFTRAYKATAKKGSYKGKISVKSLGTGRTTTANLNLNYSDWNDSLIHATPGEISMDCTVIKTPAYPSSVNFSCGDAQTYLKLYYFGSHDGIEVRSIPEKDSKRSLGLKVENKDGNVFNINNVQVFWTKFEGFPSDYSVDSGLGKEPSGTYKGVFVFLQQSTQKELLRVPYILNFTALSN